MENRYENGDGSGFYVATYQGEVDFGIWFSDDPEDYTNISLTADEAKKLSRFLRNAAENLEDADNNE